MSVKVDAIDSAPFEEIDWMEALSLEALLADVPETAQVRGMFFSDLNALIPKEQWLFEYSVFRSYPAQDYMRLLVQVADTLYPQQSPREGLRRVGVHVMQSFVESTLGRLLEFLCKDIHSLLRKSAAAMEAVQNYGSVRLLQEAPRAAELQLKGVWDFPDCHYVGLYEEIVRLRGAEPTVLMKRHSPTDVDFHISW